MSDRALYTLWIVLATLTAAWWWTHPTPAASLEPAATAPHHIDVNAAHAAELRLLPGIGPALAQRIVEDRDARGPFRDADDLQRVRGIGPRLADQARPFVRFGDTAP